MANKQCGKPGALKFIWPGSDVEKCICADCLDQLKAVARTLGVYVPMWPITSIDEPRQCGQLINEKEQPAAKEKLTYEQALHGIQSGIAMEIERGSDCASPKHLRVGVNSAMCEHAALIRMLIAKGIITEEEYWEAITDEFNRELEREEKLVNDLYGGDGRIKLR